MLQISYFKTKIKSLKMNFRRVLEMPKPYLIFAALRIILTCLPQIGYVHPDEFFQSIEVMAEKVFNVEVNKPWEFNASFPIRSVTPPYLTVGMSFHILKILNGFLSAQFRMNIITPYFVLLLPRLLICCLSFLIDWSLYKICWTNSEKYKSRCLVLSVSYVMLVYATRTFSNTIELILFSLLLYFVAESMIFSMINVRQREYINIRYKAAKTTVDKAKFHKLRLFLEDDSLRNCFIIATITAAGFFNRPTFVAYAIAPVFLWLYRGLGFKSVSSLNFHLRIFVFILCTIPTIVLFILIDSFYFGYITWGEMGVLDVSINSFVVTPLNFIKYNINPTNLAQHGLHPRYLHAAVNIPLLFNVLGLLGFYNVLYLLSYLIQAKYHYLPTVRSIRGLMTASFITPLAMLSVFPHQEPRFLIPLLLPLVYLYGSKIFPESDDIVVKSYTNYERKNVQKKTHESHVLLKIWIVINVALTLFYGFIHQGGIFPFISHLNNELKYADYRISYHVVTSHIYSVPESLFLQKGITYDNPYAINIRPKRLYLYEKGSTDLEEVVEEISAILVQCNNKTSKSRCKLYLVIPSGLIDSLHYHLYRSDSNLIFSNTLSFYPHLSIEALPHVKCLSSTDDGENFLLHPTESVIKFLKSFGLARIEFALSNKRD